MLHAYLKKFGKESCFQKEYERNCAALRQYAETAGQSIAAWHTRGTPKQILLQMQPEDTLLTPEICSLGGTLRDIRELVECCIRHRLKIVVVKDEYVFDSSLSTQLLVSALGIAIRLHSDLKSQSTRRSLHRRRAAGIKLGRPQGSRNKKLKLSGKQSEILRLLEQKVAKSEIARRLGVNRMTLYTFLRRLQK